MRLDDNAIVPFREALCEAECKECGAQIEWEAAFDADGTNYYADCCGLEYILFPHSVKVAVEHTNGD